MHIPNAAPADGSWPYLPLNPRDYLLLLLLQEEPTYGYELLERLEKQSKGMITLNAGSLYRSIARLVDAGLVEPLGETPGEGGMRKLYGVTGLGRGVLREEMSRQESILRWGRRVLPEALEGP